MFALEPHARADASQARRGRRVAPAANRHGRRLQVILTTVVLIVAAALTVDPAHTMSPERWALGAASLWLLAGGLVLRARHLVLHVAVAGLAIAATVPEWSLTAPPGVVLTLVVIDGMVLGHAASRERIDRREALGESMLVDLRDRLRAHGAVPALDAGWQVETVLRGANGDSFSGDFLVATRPGNGAWFELVLVDVSGKGRPAGARALMLSGAFGGMLGALPREQFLAAANRYVLRQNWHEEFATAVHVAVNQDSGGYRISGAGHPPAARFRAGSGRWEVVTWEQGPALGIVPDPEYPAVVGELGHGDALLLYTDGLIERPGWDVGLGLDRLMGQAERAMAGGFYGSAVTIVDGTRSGDADDRALVLIWRS